MGKAAGDAFQISKNPIPSLIMEAAEGGTEKLAVIHRENLEPSVGPKAETPF
jgi:hypothetical protein